MRINRFAQTACLALLSVFMLRQATAMQDDQARPEPSSTYDVCQDAESEAELWLDRMHGSISENLCVSVAWFDRFFGDERSEEFSPVSTFFRWRSSVRWDKLEGFEFNTRLHADLKLPRASKKLRLLISRTGDWDNMLDLGDEFNNEGSSSTEVSLRYTPLSKAQQRFTVDAGIRGGTPLNPFVRARYRYKRLLSENTQLRLTETAFWENEDGLGLNSRLDWEWYYQPQTSLRWTGSATVSESSEGVDWHSTFTAFHQLDTQRALRSEIGIFGHTEPEDSQHDIEEYYVNLRYRTNVWRKWLYLELQPELAWPLDNQDERVLSPRFLFTLEVQFERR